MSLFDGGANHYKFAVQVANEKLKGKTKTKAKTEAKTEDKTKAA